jgi:hypothetical protein
MNDDALDWPDVFGHHDDKPAKPDSRRLDVSRSLLLCKSLGNPKGGRGRWGDAAGGQLG